VDARFFRRLGASRLARTVCAAPTGAAALALYGKMAGVAFEDYPAARLIVLWGVNPSASGIHLVPFIKDARKYAQGDYAAALYKGAGLSAADKAAVAKRLSYFTGLSEDYLMKADLRVTLSQFRAELQRKEGLTTGRIDARFTGYTYDLLEENAQGDPEGPAVGGAFTALVNSYNHDELKFGKDKVYHNSANAFGSWNWTRREPRRFGFPGAPNVDQDLA